MKIAYSPCPNDTFIFHAWAHGLVPGAPPLEITYADVDVTNTLALTGEHDLIKVSAAALPWLRETHQVVPCGGALGRGCGPLVLTREPRSLAGSTVAVPGDRTTAYLLFRLWSQSVGEAPTQIKVVPFRDIMPGVRDGVFDAGLVIHEARFTYPRFGLTALADLGEWWEQDTGLPIPLGAIVAPNRVDIDTAAAWVRESLRQAWAAPSATDAYVLAHAEDNDLEVARQHIALYVNDFSYNLGPEGHAAINTLLDRAANLEQSPGRVL